MSKSEGLPRRSLYEAQDMDENEYRLVTALMERNDALRVVAVGDDDRNL